MRFLKFLFTRPTWGQQIHEDFDQFLLDIFG